MSNKSIIISIILAVFIIGGVIIFSAKNNTEIINNSIITDSSLDSGGSKANLNSNVYMENGVQIIELTARGGYTPRKSVAQAGVPTIIRFQTKNTFDCSLSVRIPSLNISQFLSQTGSTDINIYTPASGIFRGSCGMGMYPFEIDFQD